MLSLQACKDKRTTLLESMDKVKLSYTQITAQTTELTQQVLHMTSHVRSQVHLQDVGCPYLCPHICAHSCRLLHAFLYSSYAVSCVCLWTDRYKLLRADPAACKVQQLHGHMHAGVLVILALMDSLKHTPCLYAFASYHLPCVPGSCIAFAQVEAADTMAQQADSESFGNDSMSGPMLNSRANTASSRPRTVNAALSRSKATSHARSHFSNAADPHVEYIPALKLE